MKLVVEPAGNLSTRVELLPSKLHTQIACAAGILARGKSVVREPLMVRDTRVMFKVGEAFEVMMGKSGSSWVITPPEILKLKSRTIDVRNSGTALALAAALVSATGNSAVLTGDQELRNRRMIPLLSLLRKAGAEVHSVHPADAPPLVVFGSSLCGGGIKPQNDELRYLYSLLVVAPLSENGVELQANRRLAEIHANPSLEVLRAARARCTVRGNRISVSRGNLKGFEYRVPRELSSSAPFFFAPLVMEREVEARIEKLTSRDRLLIEKLQGFGIRARYKNKKIRLKADKLRGTRVDLSGAPELLPFFSVLASFARGTTTISGAHAARFMKSDRISATVVGLKKLGVKIVENLDGVTVKGPSNLRGAEVDGHNDYAVTGALAVAAFGAEKSVKINNGVESLRRSYPNFVRGMRELGAEISLSPK